MYESAVYPIKYLFMCSFIEVGDLSFIDLPGAAEELVLTALL